MVEFRCGRREVEVEKHVRAEFGQLSLVGESVLGEFETCHRDLEAEIKLKPFEEDYRNKKQDYDRINTQANALLVALEDVKLGIDIGGDIVRQVTK
ncbi:hypothetical protein QBC43DRAFT_287820 [Cladorrhinum sp. PSN259]|nr:hypothetical protein QBC43DRAFT_287820 [Cladorrhinum sp. PSN259]